MMPRILLSLAALTLLSLPALADGDPLADIIGTSWQLTSLDGAPVTAGTAATLVISADSIGGNGGCNSYGGDLVSTPTGVDFRQVFSTMMACDGLQQEQGFFAALEATDDFAIVEGNLHLLGDGIVLAELRPAS